MIFFTSILSNYLSRSLALAESAIRQHQDIEFRIYILDYKTAKLPNENWLSTNLRIQGLNNIPKFFDSTEFVPKEACLLDRYNIVEACTAVKPFIIDSLLKENKTVIYLDPDIIVYEPLEITEGCDWDIQLTPHVLQPACTDEFETALSERLFLNFGIFNLGYLAVQPSLASKKFISWWLRSCDLFGVANPSAGFYVDQKFFDFAPAFIEKLDIVRDPGCNVAWWNMFCDGRRVLKDGSNVLYNGQKSKLKFFHFSNLDSFHSKDPYIAKPLKDLDINNNAVFRISNYPALQKLFNDYRRRLNELDSLLPDQQSLANQIKLEKSLNKRISRRANDELYRLNAIFKSRLTRHHKLNQQNYSIITTTKSSLWLNLPKLVVQQIKAGMLKKQVNRAWSYLLNNFLSPSLYYYVNF